MQENELLEFVRENELLLKFNAYEMPPGLTHHLLILLTDSFY
jgi:hypothetical protein